MLNNINPKILEIAKKFIRLFRRIKELMMPFGFPQGHFYSPIHNINDLKYYSEVKKRSCKKFTTSIPGFSDKRMLNKLNKIKKFFPDFYYPEINDNKNRFYIKNSKFPITDALILFSMIRFLRPKRIIEIGSGFSSALMIDVNERFFNNKIHITFIDPYPELLNQRMNKKDKSKYRIISKCVQFVSLDIFKELEPGDILFIDSTHVSKFNSDVNYELFNILPEVKSGVVIHFHDVPDGFEYPIEWLSKGWAWNECYLLRAYLMGNINYEVLLMNDYLINRYSKILMDYFPKSNVLAGGSLWIKKTNC